MNLLYNLTKNKLKQEYINKLTQLLYNCKSDKNYSFKRINLDKAVYKYNKNNELYITLPNFNFKNKSIGYDNSINNKNSSIPNYTENGSNYLTNDTNCNFSYNKSNVPRKENKKKKLNFNDLFGQREEEQINKTIQKLLLNEDLEIPKKTEKQIFNQLKMKYKFEDPGNQKRYISHQKLKTNNNESIKINKYPNLIFPQINNKYLDYLDILKTKTNELNSIKQKQYKKYLSPIFFFGKNRAKYLNNIKYKSYNKLHNMKTLKEIRTISEDNRKYLKIMGNDINILNEVNNENKDILDSLLKKNTIN